MPTEDLPTRLSENSVAHQTYFVVASDVTIGDGPGTWHSIQTVLASAPDGLEACEVARRVLEDGFEPHAAFTRQHLLIALENMARHPLAPGEAYNRDYQAG